MLGPDPTYPYASVSGMRGAGGGRLRFCPDGADDAHLMPDKVYKEGHRMQGSAL